MRIATLLLAALLTSQRYTPATADVEPVAMHGSCSREANAEVDRGTGFVMLLATSDARGAFARAAEDDPDCALAYWGQVIARLPTADDALTLATLNAGRSIAERARAAKARTPRERQLVESAIELFAPRSPTPLGVRLDAYETRLRQLAQAQPDDDLVQVLHARAALLRSTLPGDAPRTRAVAILEAAFRNRPLSPGAAVTLLEALDAGTAPVWARRAAERLAGTRQPVPQHIALRAFVALGDWANAVRAGESALKYAGTASSPALLHGARQELAAERLAESWLQQGKRSAARALVVRLETELRRAEANGDSWPAVRLGLARAAARVALDEREVLPFAAPASTTGPEQPAWPTRFASGLLAGWHAWPGGDAARRAAARSEIVALTGAAAERPSDPEIELAGLLVEASVAASLDEQPQVTLLISHAIDLEARLDKAGRLSLPLLPARELAAEIWQRFYRYPDAERDARATLERYPNRWRPWLTLARACTALRKTDEAQAAYRRVAEIRAAADPGDAALAEARRALQSQAPPAPKPPAADAEERAR